jgi:hypothetical protein
MNLGLLESIAGVLPSTGMLDTAIQNCDLLSILPKLSHAQQNSMNQQVAEHYCNMRQISQTVHFYKANELNECTNSRTNEHINERTSQGL